MGATSRASGNRAEPWIQTVPEGRGHGGAGGAAGPDGGAGRDRPGAAGREAHLHRRHRQRRRLAQPVHRHPGRDLRGLGADVRLPGRLQPEGLLARARAGRVLGGLRRRAHLDLQDPPGREVVRRPAAHGQGRRLHLQPDHEGQLRADQLRQLRVQHQDRRGPRRRHPGDDHQGAQPDHAAAGRADPARAHLEGHRREGGLDLRQREERRRLGPVRARRAQHRPVRAPVGQQVLLGRRAQDRRGRLPGLQQRRRPAPGAEEGRDRLRRRARPGAVQLAQGHRGHHRRGRRLLRLRRAGLQHRGRP